MTGTRPADILRHLDAPGADDRTLVSRYASHGDPAAFAELVRRHGPLVWAACLRVAGHRQDAEDAFQAVFLVLVRKMAAIHNPDLLGNWLYGVAVRVAMKARRSAARRRAREVQVATMPDPAAMPNEANPDLARVIDEELAALSACYRDAVVLCDLRGAPRADAAKALGIPEGTLSSRLANGRKKLAARLARRGVVLSAAAVPGVLGQAAKATVPAELVARVQEVAAGVAVPVAVARLASGGYSVKTSLLMCVVFAAAAAGVVYATQPAEPPKPGEPPKPPVVAKADPAPAPAEKPDPDAKPGEKVAFTTLPKMRTARDHDLGNVRTIAWSPDGRSLIGWGNRRRLPDEEHRRSVALILPDVIDPKPNNRKVGQHLLSNATSFVHFAPDSKTIIIDVRKSHLISGRHELQFWDLLPAASVKLRWTVNLEDEEAYGYHFAADGKTFRTITSAKNPAGQIKATEVREVNSITGKTVKTLLKVDVAGLWLLSPDGRRFAVLEDGTKLTMYDVDAGARLFTKHLTEKPPEGAEPLNNVYFRIVFSGDGKQLVLSRGVGLTDILNTDTGDFGKTLEGVGMMATFPERGCFGAEGRLLAMTINRYTARKVKRVSGERAELESQGSALMVWDTQTGKVLKSWGRSSLVVAVNPVQPLLAIAEQNGDDTRLGLWDFSAEPEKK